MTRQCSAAIVFAAILAPACASGPAGPPVNVAPCPDVATMEPVALEIGKPAEDGVTWGPRFAKVMPRPGPNRVGMVTSSDGLQETSLSRARPGGATARLVIDASGTIVAREIVGNTGSARMGELLLEQTHELEFHPAQRNGCAIPSVVEYQR